MKTATTPLHGLRAILTAADTLRQQEGHTAADVLSDDGRAFHVVASLPALSSSPLACARRLLKAQRRAVRRARLAEAEAFLEAAYVRTFETVDLFAAPVRFEAIVTQEALDQLAAELGREPTADETAAELRRLDAAWPH